MSDRLQEILRRKRRDVAALDIVKAEPRASSFQFSKALQKPGVSVIAEIKRRSPSKGDFASIDDPAALAATYCRGGAGVISVLTEEHFFGGSLEDLRAVKAVNNTVVLRKDFLIDPIQLSESIYAGADAVLLIVAALGRETGTMLREAERLGLEALVEVQNERELEIALDCRASIIGVNNRNLHTFEEDLGTAERLIELIPDGVITVAASGMRNAEDVRRMEAAGYDAVLIGEALVRSEDPEAFIREVRSCVRT